MTDLKSAMLEYLGHVWIGLKVLVAIPAACLGVAVLVGGFAIGHWLFGTPGWIIGGVVQFLFACWFIPRASGSGDPF